jgi:hypothetical protein
MSETASTNSISDITGSSNTTNTGSSKYDIMDIITKAYSITRQFKSDIVIPENQRNKNNNTIIILKRNPAIDGDDQIIAEMNVKTMTKTNIDTDNNDDTESNNSRTDISSIDSTLDSSIGSFSTISDSTSK